MSLGKTARIVLQRCDGEEGSKCESMPDTVLNIKNDKFLRTPSVRIKLKNEAESVGTIKSIIYTPNADDSIKNTMDNTSGNYLQSNACVKAEEEEELKGQINAETAIDDPAYSNLQPNIRVKMEGEKGEKGQLNIKTAADNPVGYSLQRNMRVNVNEEGQITSELVGCLPKGSASGEGDEKALLKIVKWEGNITGLGSELTCQLSKLRAENYLLTPDVRVKVENQFESGRTVNSEIHSPKADDSVKTTVINTLGNYLQLNRRVKAEEQEEDEAQINPETVIDDPVSSTLQPNIRVKVEEGVEEKGQITSELVGCLPKSLSGGESDKKALLKIVKCERDITDVGSKPTNHLDSHSAVEETHVKIGRTLSPMSEPKKKVLSKSHQKNNNKKPYSCSLCPYRCRQQRALTRHLKAHSGESGVEEKGQITSELVGCLPKSLLGGESDKKALLKIVKCERNVTDVGSQPAHHLESHSTVGETNVKIGRALAPVSQPKREMLFKSHQKNNTGDKTFSCSLCPYKSRQQRALTRHLKVHSGERPFKCEVCPKQSKSKRALKRHMIIHVNTKRNFECNTCAAKFKSKPCLISHLRRHTDERPYSCTVCPAKFKLSNDLSAHRIIHIPERRFECAHCNDRFKLKYTLKAHLSRHLDMKPHLCTVCGMTFKLVHSLKSHLMTHSREKPFRCTQCDRSFRTKQYLTRHSSVHLNVRPFSCTQCLKTFKVNNHLRKHLKSHTSERPFKCARCGARFKTNRNLRNHLITHSDVKSFSCPHCPSLVRSSNGLNFTERPNTALETCTRAHIAPRSSNRNSRWPVTLSYTQLRNLTLVHSVRKHLNVCRT